MADDPKRWRPAQLVTNKTMHAMAMIAIIQFSAVNSPNHRFSSRSDLETRAAAPTLSLENVVFLQSRKRF